MANTGETLKHETTQPVVFSTGFFNLFKPKKPTPVEINFFQETKDYLEGFKIDPCKISQQQMSNLLMILGYDKLDKKNTALMQRFVEEFDRALQEVLLAREQTSAIGPFTQILSPALKKFRNKNIAYAGIDFAEVKYRQEMATLRRLLARLTPAQMKDAEVQTQIKTWYQDINKCIETVSGLLPRLALARNILQTAMIVLDKPYEHLNRRITEAFGDHYNVEVTAVKICYAQELTKIQTMLPDLLPEQAAEKYHYLSTAMNQLPEISDDKQLYNKREDLKEAVFDKVKDYYVGLINQEMEDEYCQRGNILMQMLFLGSQGILEHSKAHEGFEDFVEDFARRYQTIFESMSPKDGTRLLEAIQQDIIAHWMLRYTKDVRGEENTCLSQYWVPEVSKRFLDLEILSRQGDAQAEKFLSYLSHFIKKDFDNPVALKKHWIKLGFHFAWDKVEEYAAKHVSLAEEFSVRYSFSKLRK